MYTHRNSLSEDAVPMPLAADALGEAPHTRQNSASAKSPLPACLAFHIKPMPLS